jgi:hypothetical protein
LVYTLLSQHTLTNVLRHLLHYYVGRLEQTLTGNRVNYREAIRDQALWRCAWEDFNNGKPLPEAAAQDLDEDIWNGELDSFLTIEERRKVAAHVQQETDKRQATEAAV